MTRRSLENVDAKDIIKIFQRYVNKDKAKKIIAKKNSDGTWHVTADFNT